MKVVEGELKLIGDGTWADGGGGGKTVVSALDIGDNHLRKILIPDYLRNYMTPGEHIRVAISQGLSRGMITRPFIAAVDAKGKKYRIEKGTLIFAGAAKTLLYAIPVGVILGAITPLLGIAGVAGIGYYYFKEIMAINNF
ncbi:MAG: hypothetical protein Q7T00_04350 [Rugosibacter sp.]|jgi:hypothetical protein|nr:hypothetical protein [Rugosibacter sp.]MDO9273378.1 hypothetical protein [Rugosibacter sp.]